MIVSLALENFDGLRLCSQIRANEATRHLPILVIGDAEDEKRVLKALEIGVNDYLMRPIERKRIAGACPHAGAPPALCGSFAQFNGQLVGDGSD